MNYGVRGIDFWGICAIFVFRNILQETAQGVNPVRSSYVLCDVFMCFRPQKRCLFVVLQIYDMLNGKDISF